MSKRQKECAHIFYSFHNQPYKYCPYCGLSKKEYDKSKKKGGA